MDFPRWVAAWLTRGTLELLVTLYLVMVLLAFGVGMLCVIALALLT